MLGRSELVQVLVESLHGLRGSVPLEGISTQSVPQLTHERRRSHPTTETVPNLKDIVLVEGAGHWIHMEDPKPVNDAILGLLKDVGY